MEVVKRQEVLKAAMVIQFLAVGPFESSCESAALDHPSFHGSSLLSGQHTGKVTQGGIMPPCESIRR